MVEPKKQALRPSEVPNIRDTDSPLGDQWCPLFESDAEFKIHHFMSAMLNLINNPNINSTVIMRSDTLRRNKYVYKDGSEQPAVETYLREKPEELVVHVDDDSEQEILTRNLDDLEIRQVPMSDKFKPSLEVVRRMIPRNPAKDYIINQTCLILNNSHDNSTVVLYTPHVSGPDEIPYYLPPVKSIGILYQGGKISIHYMPFNSESKDRLLEMDPSERPIRIAFRLLQTARKHSVGVMNGYTKRVNHDMLISKEKFQDRYITLKQKYAKTLVDGWQEKTDPRKHVFEDLAIAAFLIEYWKTVYPDKSAFQFRDMGCGNGLLVYILTLEGYTGLGIDARARKSWASYPPEIQARLMEQVIIPAVLLRPHPAIMRADPERVDNGLIFKVSMNPKPQYQGNKKQHHNDNEFTEPEVFDKVQMVECYSSAELLASPRINTAEFPQNTFLIGNHSDEITCWLPLLGYPFMVIPCCSHNLNGEKTRYPVNTLRQEQNKTQSYPSSSRYASLVDHVEDLATLCGWKVQREMLRIPSTRNAAIVASERTEPQKSIYEVIAIEGGADRWVENTMALTRRAPRDH